MAFNPSNFNRNSIAPNIDVRDSTNLLYLYTTSDDLAGVDDPAYFDSISETLIKGDIIGVTASDGKAVYFVTNSNRNDNVVVARYV